MNKLLPIAFLILAFAVPPIVAQNAERPSAAFVVNSSADSVDAAPGDGACADQAGSCTLRAAIQEANTTAAADTISFAADFPPTITLTIGTLNVTNSITINGPGARNLTVQRDVNGSLFGIFDIAAGRTSLTTLRGFTIKGGHAVSGGAVRTSSQIVLSEMALVDNRATAGGAVFFSDTSSYQLSTIERCLISGNTATGQGGAIYLSVRPTVSVNSSTITGNQASYGGAILNNGWAILVNNTIVRNTAASRASVVSLPGGEVELFNNVIGLDVNSPGGSVSGQFSSYGRNVITNADGSTGWQATDAIGAVKDPLLGPLGNNGGPTDSIAALPGSPLIDAGFSCPPILPIPTCVGAAFSEYGAYYDQRGYVRGVGTVDIGAVEYGASPLRGQF